MRVSRYQSDSSVESGNHLALELETRCLTATAVKLGCHPWRAGTAQFRSDWSAIWVYNPRNGIRMQHGFEESGDVQDIRLVVDTAIETFPAFARVPLCDLPRTQIPASCFTPTTTNVISSRCAVPSVKAKTPSTTLVSI